jgi:hypothetical protein
LVLIVYEGKLRMTACDVCRHALITYKNHEVVGQEHDSQVSDSSSR